MCLLIGQSLSDVWDVDLVWLVELGVWRMVSGAGLAPRPSMTPASGGYLPVIENGTGSPVGISGVE